MNNELLLRVFDVEHGACAMLASPTGERIAMIDSGHNATTGWRPSSFIRYGLRRTMLDYLFVTNADHDHVSDLDGFRQHGVNVSTFYRNPSPGPALLRLIKMEESQSLTNDLERYLQMYQHYTGPVTVPFEVGMAGVTCSMFWHRYPWFTKTNNLSLVVFIRYGPFKMLFPGDLQEDGWQAMLAYPPFVRELQGTTILVASHHGRKSGYCADIFKHCTPSAIVISDKPKAHLTQDVDYRKDVHPLGVVVTNQLRRRHVLTTRRDGDILFRVQPDGSYWITTEKDWYCLRAA